MRGQREGKEDARKGRERVLEVRREMEMKEPTVEIRGERWDVKHQRRGWRILSIQYITNDAARRQSGRWTLMKSLAAKTSAKD